MEILVKTFVSLLIIGFFTGIYSLIKWMENTPEKNEAIQKNNKEKEMSSEKYLEKIENDYKEGRINSFQLEDLKDEYKKLNK